MISGLRMKILLTIIVFTIWYTTGLSQAARDSVDAARLQSLLQQSHADSIHHDFRAALKHFYQYRVLKESVFDEIKQSQSNQLNRQYQTAKKDMEIASGEKNIGLLTTQNKLIAKNILQTKANRNLIIAIAAVIAMLLVTSYLQYSLKRNANLRLEKQRLAIDQKNERLQLLSEQKDDLLEEKEVLIKEIHHRVKNNLQVVISLLNTQSAYLNDPFASAALRQSQHRMQSISLIHQKLYQSESRALINMRDYTHELVMYLRQSFDTSPRIGFTLDIDNIDLDVLRAVPVALVLNEAITNALKYAFPDNNDGIIEIELRCVDGHQLKVAVTDDGTGLPPGFDVDLCKSLGINLMKGMCREIKGQLAIQSKNGLAVMLTFPAEHTHFSNQPIYDISSIGDEA